MEEQLEDEVVELKDDEKIEVEIEEIIEEDHQIESLAISKSLRFRVTSGIVLLILFLLFRRLDLYGAFNPINSSAFTLITIVILVYCLIVIFVDYSTNDNEYHKLYVLKRLKRLNGIYDYFSIVPYLMIGFTLVNMFLFSFSPISGSSMEPNFSDDEAVVFSHLSESYERFDVVIIYVEEFSDPYLIKRVIGLPGETIIIDHNEIFIEVDGEKTLINQDFIDTDIVNTVCYNNIDKNYCSWTLGDDEYIVLGDNRDGNGVDDSISHGYSLDSRKFDEVNITEIYGKVIFKFKDFNILK